MKRTLSVLAFVLLCQLSLLAQITGGGNVSVTGAITVGHCVSFANSSTIQDAGGVCGGTGSAPGGSSGNLQYNSSGSFGGTADFSLSVHTISSGASGILDLHLGSLLLPGSLSTGFVRVTTSTGVISGTELSGDCTTSGSGAITC